MKKLFAILFLIVGGFAASQAQSAAPPATPAGEVFSAWLTAFNSADRATLLAFHTKYGRGDPRDVDRDLDFRERTGGFELRAIERDTPTSLVALLREKRAERFGRIQIDVEAGPPPHITGMMIRPAAAPAPRLSEADAIASLQARLDQETAAGRFAGAVLVARQGKILFQQGYGLADRARAIPNSVDTRFRIGSMNKMFTAVAVLQLAEAGKVSLDDPLIKFLPDYPNRELATKVTLDHLLTHRGGTGDFFVPEYFANKDHIRTFGDYIALLGKRPLAFEPGERFDYSNYGYLLLGAVIERVTGRSYYDYVHSEIHARAGMRRTGSEPEDRHVKGLAVGYTRGEHDGEWRPNTADLPYRGTSAGGGYSTVADLSAFAEALRLGKLLGPTYTAKMLAGYALRDMRGDGSGYVGHNGGAPGMNGDLRIYAGGYVTVALANLDPPVADDATEFLDARLPLVR